MTDQSQEVFTEEQILEKIKMVLEHKAPDDNVMVTTTSYLDKCIRETSQSLVAALSAELENTRAELDRMKSLNDRLTERLNRQILNTP